MLGIIKVFDSLFDVASIICGRFRLGLRGGSRISGIGVHIWGPQGFWGSGENGYLFSGSWGALVII